MRLESQIIEDELIEGFDIIEETIIKLDEVEKYINRIKDEFKKTYASEYFNYIKGESNEPEVPSALSFLDAQKVRINIQGMTEGLLFESPIQVKGWTQSSVEKFGKTIGKNPQQHGFFDACVSRMEGKKGFDSDKAKRFCASIKDASYGSAFWRGKGKKKKDIEKDVKKKPFPKMDLTERKFDLGSGTMGNGVVVWNRAKEVHGDYEKVAHIDRNRKIKYYIKNPPKQVKDYAEKIAKGKNFAGSTSQPHMKVFKEEMDLIEKYLGESNDLKFNKTNFHKIAKSGKGLVVYATGGGYSDTKEFALTSDQMKKAIEKGKLDIIFKNAEMAVKGAKDPKMKGRKFMVRID